MALLASSAHRFALHSRGSARQGSYPNKNRGGLTAVAAAQISIKGKPIKGGFDLQKKDNDYGYKQSPW